MQTGRVTYPLDYDLVGVWSGGFLQDPTSSTLIRYPLCYSSPLSLLLTSKAYSNGSFPWSSGTSHGDIDAFPNSILQSQQHNSSPLITSTPEYPTSLHRMFYPGLPQTMPSTAGYPNPVPADPVGINEDQNPFFNLEPPRARIVRSNNHFGTLQGNSDLYQCTAEPCTASTFVRTYLTLSSTWDPLSGRTVIARVDTPRQEAQVAAYGQIHLHPGFQLTNHLRASLNASANLSFPPNFFYPDFNYEGRTDWPVGVACADETPFSGFDYNCILAWAEMAHPEHPILYAYFRVNTTSQTIELAPGSPQANALRLDRQAAGAYGGVSAAWFNGRFFLAWKQASTSLWPGLYNIAYASTQGAPQTWSDLTVINTGKPIIHRPTFHFTPHLSRETALVWTEEP